MKKLLAILIPIVVLVSCSGQDGTTGKTPAFPADGPGAIVLVTVENWWTPASGDTVFGELGGEGFVAFADVMTASPQARPAVTSVLTGLGPDRHGVLADLGPGLSTKMPTVQDRITRAGWRSAAFVANPDLGIGSGLDRGFELFDAPSFTIFGPERFHPPLRPAEEVVGNFLAWHDTLAADQPYFAWIHLSGGPRGLTERGSQGRETPYDQPSDLRSAVDHVIAALNEGGELETTTVVVVATAGGTANEPAQRSGYVLSSEVLSVPLVVHDVPAGPGLPAPHSPVWTPDLAGWMLERAGIDPNLAAGPGLSPTPRARLAWTYVGALEFGWPPETAIVDGSTLIALEAGESQPRTYAWPSGEEVSATVDPETLAILESRAAPADLALSPVVEIPGELRDELERSGRAIPDLPPSANTSPRAARLAALPHVFSGRRAMLTRMGQDLRRGYLAAIEVDPLNRGAIVEFGEFLASANRYRKSRERLDVALPMDPYNPDIWHALAHAAYAAEDLDGMKASTRMTLELRPDDADALYDMVCVRSLAGDTASALEYLERAWSAGFRNFDHIEADADLRNLREDPGFGRFMQRVVR